MEKLTATSLYADAAELVLPMAVKQPAYGRLSGSEVPNTGLIGKMHVIFEVDTIPTENGWRVRYAPN